MHILYDLIRDQLAETDFAVFRESSSWYNDIHPILKDLLSFCKGLVALVPLLLVSSALLVEKYSHQGYVGTCFRTETDLAYELRTFKQKTTVDDFIEDEFQVVLA